MCSRNQSGTSLKNDNFHAMKNLLHRLVTFSFSRPKHDPMFCLYITDFNQRRRFYRSM